MAQQMIAGGQTSALVTQEINDNFTELYTGVGNAQGRLDEINNYIVAEGTSGVWDYRVWHNGKIEMWGFATIKVSNLIQGGFSGWDTWRMSDRLSYPTIINFNPAPREYVSIRAPFFCTPASPLNLGSGQWQNTKTATAICAIARPTSEVAPSGDAVVYFEFYVIGNGTYTGS